MPQEPQSDLVQSIARTVTAGMASAVADPGHPVPPMRTPPRRVREAEQSSPAPQPQPSPVGPLAAAAKTAAQVSAPKSSVARLAAAVAQRNGMVSQPPVAAAYTATATGLNARVKDGRSIEITAELRL
jgi:hypothetical protein